MVFIPVHLGLQKKLNHSCHKSLHEQGARGRALRTHLARYALSDTNSKSCFTRRVHTGLNASQEGQRGDSLAILQSSQTRGGVSTCRGSLGRSSPAALSQPTSLDRGGGGLVATMFCCSGVDLRVGRGYAADSVVQHFWTATVDLQFNFGLRIMGFVRRSHSSSKLPTAF